MNTVTWQIDADGRLVAFSDSWRHSIPEAHRAALDPAALIGRNLLSCCSTVPLKAAYGDLLAVVRREQVRRRVSYRCDTAACRRWFLLTITPGSRDTITFATRLMRSAERVAQVAWELGPLGHTPAREFCSQCNRVAFEPYGWFELEDLISLNLFAPSGPPCLRPGLCPECARTLRAAAA